MRFVDDANTGANSLVNGDLTIQGFTLKAVFNF